MPRVEIGPKWKCEHCTYMNWPTSQKCAMCRMVHPSNVISQSHKDEAGIKEDSNNIVASCFIYPSKQERSTVTSVDNIIVDGRWQCSICTFQNYEKSLRCTMCSTAQPNNTIENYQKKQNDYNPHQSKGHGKTKIHSADLDKQDKIERNKSNTNSNVPKSNLKWFCSKCTYENWPKAQKCTLCHQPKRNNRQDMTLDRSSTKNSSKAICSGMQSPRRSPPRSPVGACHHSGELPALPQDDIIALSELMAKTCKLRSNDNEAINQIRNRMLPRDWLWLASCKAVVDHDPSIVSTYIASGGDRTRMLTKDDVLVLQRPTYYEVGHTLVHLSIRFHREDILRILLTPEVPSRALKRLPCHVSPELAVTIRKQLSHAIRQKKGSFPCSFFTENVTFVIPAEVEEFNSFISDQILGEILDFDVQKVLEEEDLINWSDELVSQYGSRVFPLWNRAAGDCLLDSVLQATWGVLDRDNVLRKTLFESLSEGERRFFPRWKEAEEIQASEMNYSLDEEQWRQDWENIVSLAATVGNSLEQMHVFALAHILRRPIIVYAVKYVKSRQGETIDMARFEGVYLPLLWEESFCWKSPIALGYTRGHFSALVPMEASNSCYAGAGANIDWRDSSHVTYLPLVDHEGQLLPVHFLTLDELGQDERLLHNRLDCCLTNGGILVAKQQCTPRPALVNQMIDEWIDRFRRMQGDLTETRVGAYKSMT